MLLALTMLLSQIKWVVPYESVSPAVNASRYFSKVKEGDANIFVDHDLLTMVSKGEKDPLMMMDWFQVPAIKVQDSDIWVRQARMKSWDGLFFRYGIRGADQKLTWRLFVGPKAPKMVSSNPKIKGTVTKYTFASKILAEDRNLFVYLPPNPIDDMPAVVMADGESCQQFAEAVDPLIVAKKVRPFVIVGIQSGGYRGPKDKFDFNQDFRMKEYLKVADPDRFAAHLSFVCDEVLPWAREKFHVTTKREETAVFGYSNGGAFAMTATIDRPEVFGICMPSSVAAFDPKALEENAAKGKGSKFYFVAGSLEVFTVNTHRSEKILTDAGVTCSLQEYVSGHDLSMWQLGFNKNVQSVFPLK